MIRLLHNRPLPKDIAKNRLKVIIINDREGITPYVLDIIKNEILTIISKYIDIDTDRAVVNVINDPNQDESNYSTSLVATVPFYRNNNK